MRRTVRAGQFCRAADQMGQLVMLWVHSRESDPRDLPGQGIPGVGAVHERRHDIGSLRPTRRVERRNRCRGAHQTAVAVQVDLDQGSGGHRLWPVDETLRHLGTQLRGDPACRSGDIGLGIDLERRHGLLEAHAAGLLDLAELRRKPDRLGRIEALPVATDRCPGGQDDRCLAQSRIAAARAERVRARNRCRFSEITHPTHLFLCRGAGHWRVWLVAMVRPQAPGQARTMPTTTPPPKSITM